MVAGYCPWCMCTGDKERGRNNFRNYASQHQAIFARSTITKILK